MTARAATLDRPADDPRSGLRARLPVSVRHWYRLPAVLGVAWVAGLGTVWAWAAHVYYKAPHGFVDLAVYRFGIRAWWHAGNMYGKLPATVAGHLPFVYPPITVILLGPLEMVSWGHAIILTELGSLLGLAVTGYLIFLRVFPGAGRRGALLASAVLLPASLLLEPVWDTIWYGQINIVLMAMVVVDCLMAGKRWPRGVLIGIAAAIKLTPAVFLVYFLVRRDYRSALRLAVTAGVLTLLGFAVSWSGSLKYWFGSTGGARSIGGSAYYTNQTVAGALARTTWPAGAQFGLWVLAGLLLLALTAVAIRRAVRAGDVPLAVVVTAGFGLIVSPTSWSNHWVYAVPAIVVLAGRAWQRRRDRRAAWWALTALALAVVFYAAPFLDLGPHSARWSLLDQLPGNAFTLLSVVALVGYAVPDVPRTVRAVRARLVGHTRPAGER